MRRAQVEAVPSGCGICRFCLTGFNVIRSAFHHTCGCKQCQAAATGFLKRIGNKVVARLICQRVVVASGIADGTGDKGVTLLGIRDGITAAGAATRSSSASASTLVGTCTDTNARSCNLNVGIVVAVESFFWRSLGGIGKGHSVANGNSTCSACVRVNGIVTG